MEEILELEISYLAAGLPPGLDGCPKVIIEDVYFPAESEHAQIRIRRKGDAYEFTKKTSVDPNDFGKQREQNIAISADEYQALAAGRGRKIAKTRHYLPFGQLTAEVDVFLGELKGLVVIEFEFTTPEAKDTFIQPDFCLADVTQEAFIAGGVLAGKSYADIEQDLIRFSYQPLYLS